MLSYSNYTTLIRFGFAYYKLGGSTLNIVTSATSPSDTRVVITFYEAL